MNQIARFSGAASSTLMLCLLNISSASGTDISIVGLKLQMTYNTTHATIGSNYKFKSFPENDPALQVETAVKMDGSDGFVLGFAGGKLWYASHVVQFTPEKQPSVSGVKRQLVDKYDIPMLSAGDGMTWSYGKTNVSRHSANDSLKYDECEQAILAYSGPPKKLEQIAPIQTQFPEICDTTVAATWQRAATNNDLVDILSVVMSDGRFIYGFLSDEQAEMTKRQHDAAERAKNNAAPL